MSWQWLVFAAGVCSLFYQSQLSEGLRLSKRRVGNCRTTSYSRYAQPSPDNDNVDRRPSTNGITSNSNSNIVGGVDSSLITLLNLAQEISSSSNIRFSKAADKLRNQFARSFSVRYDIEKSQFLSVALSSIDGDDKMTEEQKVLRDVVLSQLRSIERRASSIIFFNEPLPNLDEFKYPFDYPYEAFQPCHLAAGDGIGRDGATGTGRGGDSTDLSTTGDKEKAVQKRNAQYVQSLLDRFKGPDDSKIRMTEKDLRKLKLGLQVEARKWRNEAARLVTTSVAAGEKVRKTANELLVEPVVREILQRESELSADGVSPRDDNSARRSPVDDVEKNRVIKHFRKATGGRWRASLELIESAHSSPTSGMLTYDGIATKSTASSDPNPTPNYALLLHSCLVLSLSTYNLKLSGEFGADWLDFQFGFDGEATIEKVREAVANAADALIAAAATSTTGGESAAVALRTPSVLEEIDIQRAQTLVYTALGSSGYPRDALSLRTVHSDKACAILLHDRVRNTVIVAFRGTKDPIDILTDIVFFSAPFAPRTAPLERNPQSPGAILSSAPSVGASASQPGGGAGVGEMEVHMGFLGAFESIRGKIDAVLGEIIPKGGAPPTLLMTGHSMGGALAQVASAYYADMSPHLVTFAAPAVGNSDFCRFVDRSVYPFGGLRVWNEYDAIPYIALLVGYQHAGVPLKVRLKKSAKELFQNESINPIAAALDVVSPHVLYQIGSLIHVFPVIGSEIGSKVGPRPAQGQEQVAATASPAAVADPPATTNPSPRSAEPAPTAAVDPTSAATAATGQASRVAPDGSSGRTRRTLAEQLQQQSQSAQQPPQQAASTESALPRPAMSSTSTPRTSMPSLDVQSGQRELDGSSRDFPMVSAAMEIEAAYYARRRQGKGEEGLQAARRIVDEMRLGMVDGVDDEEAEDDDGPTVSPPSPDAAAIKAATAAVATIADTVAAATTTRSVEELARKMNSFKGKGQAQAQAQAQAQDAEARGQPLAGAGGRSYRYSEEELSAEGEADADAGVRIDLEIDLTTLPSPSPSPSSPRSSAVTDFPEYAPFQPVFSVIEREDSFNLFIPDDYYDQFRDEKPTTLSGFSASIDDALRKGDGGAVPAQVASLLRELTEGQGDAESLGVVPPAGMKSRTREVIGAIYNEIKDQDPVSLADLRPRDEEVEEVEDDV